MILCDLPPSDLHSNAEFVTTFLHVKTCSLECSFFCDLNIVNVAFAHPGVGYANEARLGAPFFDVGDTHVTHAGAQSAQ